MTLTAAPPALDGFSLVALTGNDFATLTTGPAGFGVYRLTADSATLGDLIDLETGDAPAISESTGQQSLIAPDGTSATIQRLSAKGGTLTVGTSHVLHAPAGGVIAMVATDGPRTAVVSTVGQTSRLTITGATARPITTTVALSTNGLALSGHRVLVTDEQNAPEGAYEARSRLLDLNRTGVHWTAVPDVSALLDHWLAYEKNDGSVWLRDLDKPKAADKRLTQAGPPSNPVGDHGTISISGDWVTWTEFEVGNGYERISGAYQLSTRRLLTLPFTDPVQSNGLVAYADPARDLHLYTLATGTDLTVSGEGYSSHLSLSDTAMSYVDLAGQAEVVPIASLVTAPPRALPVSAPATKAPFIATFETTRPLASWTLQVRSAKGALVFASKGSAPTGCLRAAWGGRDSHGRRLPAGAYRWTVTGKGPGGSLTTSAGKGVVTGVVHL